MKWLLCVRAHDAWNLPVCRHGGTRGKRRTDFKYLNWFVFYQKCTKPFLARNRYALRTGAVESFRATSLATILTVRLCKTSLYSCGIVGGRRARNRYALRGHRGTLFRASGGDDGYGAAVGNIADKPWERNAKPRRGGPPGEGGGSAGGY